MQTPFTDRPGERGFTLIEVLAATFILLIGVLATAAIIDASSSANANTRQRDAATNLTRELIEGARSIPFERVSEPGVYAALQEIPGLEDMPGGGYEIRRNGVTYTIEIDVCIMDDPKDESGPRVGTETFCPDSAAPGTEDKNPEDYKRVTTTISWERNGVARRVVQTGIINNPGSASGPAIRSIVPRGIPVPYVVTSETATEVLLDITTSSKPAAINWLLDGTVQEPAPVENGTTGLAWVATWDIGTKDTGTLDGDYIVSAEAFNQYGVSGPGRQETVILNRRVPFAPEQVTGGRNNFDAVEIEWTANRERDIIGYEVQRGDGTIVCALLDQRLSTFCTDPAPPDADAVEYVVYAYDRDPATGQPRSGDLSDPLVVTKGNLPPFPPTNLQASRTGDIVTLSWHRPSPEDPDGPPDGIEFYRIYRDGQALESRYARWFDPAAIVTWEDTNTGGLQHRYWVTAVDRNYAESPYLGPVTQ